MQLKFNLFEDMEREDTPNDVRDKQCTVCEEVFPVPRASVRMRTVHW